MRRARRAPGSARCSTSSPTTWRSPGPRTAGGGTCSRTGRRQPLRRRTSTSTGTRPRRSCATRCCCRSSATTTAGCSSAGELTLERDGGRFAGPLLRPRASRSRPASLDGLLADAAAGAGADELGVPGRRAFGACRRPTAHRPRRAWPSATATRRCCARQLARLLDERARAWPPRVDAAVADLNADPDAPRRPARAAELPPRLLAHRRARSSTTAASSTSTRSSACGSRTRDVFADTHALVLALGRATASSTGCASTTPTACATPSGYLDRLRARPPAARGSWSRRSSSRARRCPTSWPVAGTTGYDFARPSSAGCSSTPPASGPLTEALRAAHRRRRPTSTTVVRDGQARWCCASCWPPTSTA